MHLNRREFLAGAVAFGALANQAATAGRPLKFLFMSDTHIERDFWERDHPVYTCWKPGNHAALVKTYEFINADPYCRDIDFAFFCGDQLNTGYTAQQQELDAELAIWNETLAKLDIHAKTRGTDLSSFKFVSRPYTCTQNLGRGNKPFDVTPGHRHSGQPRHGRARIPPRLRLHVRRHALHRVLRGLRGSAAAARQEISFDRCDLG